MDMSGDPFGLLAVHPMAPLVTLHHGDYLDPIFPSMTNRDAMRHLYKAAELDPHRILQQTVCYDRWFSWTISISWGYAVEVFGNHVLLPDVLRVPATFRPWKKGNLLHTLYSFDMREQNKDPCKRPVVFHMNMTFLDEDQTVSIYKIVERTNCTSNLGSPRGIEMIKVHAPKLKLDMKQVNMTLLNVSFLPQKIKSIKTYNYLCFVKQLLAPRRQCCDILPSSFHERLEIGIRECHEDELIQMPH